MFSRPSLGNLQFNAQRKTIKTRQEIILNKLNDKITNIANGATPIIQTLEIEKIDFLNILNDEEITTRIKDIQPDINGIIQYDDPAGKFVILIGTLISFEVSTVYNCFKYGNENNEKLFYCIIFGKENENEYSVFSISPTSIMVGPTEENRLLEKFKEFINRINNNAGINEVSGNDE